jgi:hypothetical protein
LRVLENPLSHQQQKTEGSGKGLQVLFGILSNFVNIYLSSQNHGITSDQNYRVYCVYRLHRQLFGAHRPAFFFFFSDSKKKILRFLGFGSEFFFFVWDGVFDTVGSHNRIISSHHRYGCKYANIDVIEVGAWQSNVHITSVGKSLKMARIYVGNLPIDIREREIDDLFYKVIL